jgi:NADH:ubiquinone oxidoreductase subunit 6 (subunit J)
MARKVLIIYGALMLLALGLTYLVSLGDTRTLREVGIWVKPMKFMAATVLFAWTTVWLVQLCAAPVSQSQPFAWIAALLILTSLFEVYDP